MFIQYKQNMKRETKKDISEWYKPVFDTIESPSKSKKQDKARAQPAKKSKSEAKKVSADTKHQSKQLKILMRKNESYNEVPLA